MSLLVTGGSGFLGSALSERLLEKGHRIYSLSRHPPQARENLIPLVGDITEPNLGLKEVPKDIHAVHHLAAVHRLSSQDKDGEIWKTNVEGTKNVIDFCVRHNIGHLYFTSSAYTMGRNVYERTKALCELMIKESDIPKVTIFKPSVVLGTEKNFYPGHVSQFVTLVIKVHQRAEIVRRKIEGTLRLPILEPVLRIRGNPDGTLNVITVDSVVEAMASITKPGIYYLTNPEPPTLKELVDWIGEFILVKLKIEPYFKATPIEAMFEKLSSAFQPYLLGDDMKSSLRECHPKVDKAFIHETIKRTLRNLP